MSTRTTFALAQSDMVVTLRCKIPRREWRGLGHYREQVFRVNWRRLWFIHKGKKHFAKRGEAMLSGFHGQTGERFYVIHFRAVIRPGGFNIRVTDSKSAQILTVKPYRYGDFATWGVYRFSPDRSVE